MLEDFEAIAKKDRQKKISRSRSRRRDASSGKAEDSDFVEISYDTWNVLQIDSHSDGLGMLAIHSICPQLISFKRWFGSPGT